MIKGGQNWRDEGIEGWKEKQMGKGDRKGAEGMVRENFLTCTEVVIHSKR